ncbi:hypothetical protein, partial [Aneurinibacillus aneurinilyticus]|uniref:hypothetical protein n=1 Tax=Aneurinibacillus aneurinilyticus TaxID=1391 RepID=UPI0023F48773
MLEEIIQYHNIKLSPFNLVYKFIEKFKVYFCIFCAVIIMNFALLIFLILKGSAWVYLAMKKCIKRQLKMLAR